MIKMIVHYKMPIKQAICPFIYPSSRIYSCIQYHTYGQSLLKLLRRYTIYQCCICYLIASGLGVLYVMYGTRCDEALSEANPSALLAMRPIH